MLSVVKNAVDVVFVGFVCGSGFVCVIFVGNWGASKQR